MLSHRAIFNLVIIETYFSYGKDIWIAVTDYNMYFYLLVLYVLVAILQLINFIEKNLTEILNLSHSCTSFFSIL